MRRQVLLPQPEGPTRTRNSLSLISRLMSCTTSTLPKRLYTCSNRTRAITVTPFRSCNRHPCSVTFCNTIELLLGAHIATARCRRESKGPLHVILLNFQHPDIQRINAAISLP